MTHSRFMLDLATLYPEQGKTAVLTPPTGQQLELQTIQLINMSATAADLAVMIKLGDSGYTLGLVQGGSPAVDVTAAIQGGTAQAIFTTVNNDGFLVQSRNRFSLVGFTISQSGAGGTYSYQYYNGTSYVPLPATRYTQLFSATGDTVVMFVPPVDWVAGTTVGVGGETTMYSLYVQATTAPATGVEADDIWVGRMISYLPQVGQYGVLSAVWSERYPRMLDGEEGIMPFFGVADDENTVTVQYFSRG